MYKLYDDSTFIDLDIHLIEVETGLPESFYRMQETIGDGGLVTGVGFLSGRVFEITKTFIRQDEATRQLLLDWFTRPPYKSLWLEKATTDSFTGRVKVRPQLTGGEKYLFREYVYSDNVGFNLIAEDPYFTSTTESSTFITLTSSTETSGTVTLAGAKNFCKYALSSTDAWTSFQVKTDEDYGFLIEYAIAANSTLEVSTTKSVLSVTIDNNTIFGSESSGSTPFELNSSDNILYVTGAVGTMTMTYYERRL
jgi:hypothetical protein